MSREHVKGSLMLHGRLFNVVKPRVLRDVLIKAKYRLVNGYLDFKMAVCKYKRDIENNHFSVTTQK